MNSLLISFPDNYFYSRHDDHYLLEWGYAHDDKLYDFYLFMLDALAIAADYPSVAPNRGDRFMLHFAIIKMFSKSDNASCDLTNAFSTLREFNNRKYDDSITATCNLFQKAIIKAFTLAKAKVLPDPPALNEDVCYTFAKLDRVAQVVDPYFTIQTAPVVECVQQKIKKARHHFGLPKAKSQENSSDPDYEPGQYSYSH